jgi:hypothetical protein
VSASVIDRNIHRRFPAHLAALAAVLIAAVLAELVEWPALYGIIATCFAVGLVLARSSWMTRRGGGIALFLATAAMVGTIVSGGNLGHVAFAAARMSDVIILILCVALIRPALAELKLDHAIAAMAAWAPRPLRGCAILLGVTVFGLGLSFGAISVFGGSLRGRTNDDAQAARAAMRGLSLSMLLGPSTASVAAVMAAYPLVGWGDALWTGLPIAIAGVVLGSFGARRLTISAPPASPGELARAILAILAVPICAVILHLALGLSIILGIATSAVGVSIFLLICATRAASGLPDASLRFDTQIGEAWAGASAEIALFLACGLVLGAMREPVLAETARAFIVPLLPSGPGGVLLLAIAVPLIAAIGIHPMAMFAILGPVVTPALLGLSEPDVLQAWIVIIGLSMIVSPASILTMTTVCGFGVPARALCLRGNGLYALSLAVVATSLLFFWPASFALH